MNNVRIPGGAAGGHLDPDRANKHEGPAGAGHLGDLPVLEAAANGTATQTLTAPRIKDVATLKKRALIIHANGDNYSDQPTPWAAAVAASPVADRVDGHGIRHRPRHRGG